MKIHTYRARVHWAPLDGEGTKSYRSYSRDHTIGAEGKPAIEASSDPAFRGNPQRYNPEELLIASLTSCHMLWYLHLCAINGITVVEYRDDAFGVMEENADGFGQFVEAELRPSVRLAENADRSKALALHEEAHRRCFIAASVNFRVSVNAEVL